MGQNVRFAFKRVLRFKRILNQNEAKAQNVIDLIFSKLNANQNASNSENTQNYQAVWW